MKHGQGWLQGEAVTFCLIMIANETRDGLWPSKKKNSRMGWSFSKEFALVESTICRACFLVKTVNSLGDKLNVRIVSFRH